MIFCHRPEKPFWRFVHPTGVDENLLGYTCAPNAADASYAGALQIEQFIAYGFQTSFLSPNDFTLWWRLEEHDIQWLREYFLRVLEDTLQVWYREGHEWDLPVTDFGDISNDACLNVGNSDEGEDEEVMFRWVPDHLSDEVLAMSLDCAVMASADSKAHGGDPVTIFLAREAMEDKERVRCAIQWARKQNALPEVKGEGHGVPEAWDALGVPLRELPPKVNQLDLFVKRITSCFDFGKWYEGDNSYQSL